MPRNVSGTYTLPLPPVVPNTVIESSWANTTMDDLAAAITNSLDRNGNGGMIAPFRVVDGTETAPGFSFVAETGSGLFRESTGVVGMSILGDAKQYWNGGGSNIDGDLGVFGTLGVTGIATFDTDVNVFGELNVVGNTDILGDVTIGGVLTVPGVVGNALLPDGSAANPSLAFENDIDMGLFRAGSDILGFTTAGVERMRINAAGFVGIGVSPVAKLQVEGTFAASDAGLNSSISLYPNAVGGPSQQWFAGATDWRATLTAATDTWAISSGAAPRLQINAAGFVGIGTTPTTAQLEILGNYMSLQNGSYHAYLGSGTLVTGGAASSVALRSDGALLLASGGGTPRLLIAATGQLQESATLQELGWKDVPAGALAGVDITPASRNCCIPLTTNPVLAAGWGYTQGMTFSLYNNTAGNLTLSSPDVTIRLAGTATTGSRTLATRALCTIWMHGPTEAIVSGAGVT